MKFLREYTISTHAPAGGATQNQQNFRRRKRFLLTPLREGRRINKFHSDTSCFCISTHAPAGGATGCKPYSFPNWKISTHAPAGGATSAAVTDGTSRTLFLLTPLREGRPVRGKTVLPFSAFLLTPLREGRHKWFLKEWRMRHISTHAPAGGATAKPGYGVQGHHISTHAPAGGATSPEDAASRSAPLFLLTPLREGRPQAGRRRHHGHRISTHAPAGGATRWPRRSARR